MIALRYSRHAVLSLAIYWAAGAVDAADSYLEGTISDTSSIPAGLIIRLDSGIPKNCANTPHGWMLIKQESKTMTALTLLTLASGKKRIVVYTNGIGGSGFCEVNQIDPHEV